MKKTVLMFFFTMALSIASFAQEVNGKWKGTVMDQFEVAYNFQAEGEVLKGTTTGPDGNEVAIKNGKISGDKIEFVIDVMGTDTKVTGVVAGEKLTLKLNAMGNDIEILLTKVK